jgi:hypothetical protein
MSLTYKFHMNNILTVQYVRFVWGCQTVAHMKIA